MSGLIDTCLYCVQKFGRELLFSPWRSCEGVICESPMAFFGASMLEIVTSTPYSYELLLALSA